MRKIYLSSAKGLCAFMLSFFFVFEIGSINAASKVWSYTGATGGWAAPTNWVGGAVPVDGDDVTIGNTATTTFNNVPSLNLNSLTIGSTSSVSLASTGGTLTIASLNVTGKDLTIGYLLSMTVTNGSVASGKKITVNSSRNLTITGTLAVAGSISNSGTITVNGLLNFTGSSPVAPNNVTVSSGGEIRFSGSGSVTGLGSSITNGLCTFAGTTGTTTGFVASWGFGSTLQYAGTSSQTANYYEFPSTSPTNVIINNSAGVKFNTSVPPNPVITGTLTLTSGVLAMGSVGSYPTLTFQTGDVPIVRGSGSIDPGSPSTSTIVFGTAGNSGGSAFTLPDNLFSPNTTIYRLNVQRNNQLTLNNQDLTVSLFCSLNLGQVILGAGDLAVNASAVATTGTFGTSTMFVTSSSSGILTHKFDTTTTAKSFTYPIGEIAGTASYNGFPFTMNTNEGTAKQIGFKVVDDICNSYIGSATNYTTRYYGTSITGSGNYNYSVSLPYLAAASIDCSGGGGDLVGLESAMAAAYYDFSSWKACGTVVSPNLVISNASETTAPLGYDIMGIDGAGTVSVNNLTPATQDLNIYPNPADHFMVIDWLSSVREKTDIAIVNMLGEKVFSASLFFAVGKGEAIDISALSPGVYFVKAETQGSTFTRKFIKQ